MSEYKGKKLNEHWSEDSIVNCYNKLCYTEEWGYFVFGGVQLDIISSQSLYEEESRGKYKSATKVLSYPIQNGLNKTMDDIDSFLDKRLYTGMPTYRRDLKPGVDFVQNIPGDGRMLVDAEEIHPEKYNVRFTFRECKFDIVKPDGKSSSPSYLGNNTSTFSRLFSFEDSEKARKFLLTKILVCDVNDETWQKLSVPNILNHKTGDKLYCAATGEAEITEIYDQPAEFKVRIRLPSGGESNHKDFSQLRELPTFVDTEFDELNRAFKEQLLSPYAVREGNILNVHWFKVAAAAAYHVALYRLVYRNGLPCVMKMEDFNVDRNTLFLSVGGLVGSDFLIKVYAEDRDGETVSESRCIRDSGEPVSIKRKL